MLRRVHRLSREKDIRAAVRSRRAVHTPWFTLRYTDAPPGVSQPRFCFVVSTKAAKKATARNLLKRRLREAVRKHLAEFPTTMDYVFLTRRTQSPATQHELERQITALTRRLHTPTPRRHYG